VAVADAALGDASAILAMPGIAAWPRAAISTQRRAAVEKRLLIEIMSACDCLPTAFNVTRPPVQPKSTC